MRIIVDTKQKKESLGDLYGIFFEDLNHAADGGFKRCIPGCSVTVLKVEKTGCMGV